MINRVMIFLLMTAVSGMSAQKISLSGKVTNTSGKVISGAIVSLKSKNLKDTTDATGTYTLANGISDIIASPKSADVDAVLLENNSIKVKLAQPLKVRIELFDIRGKLLGKYDNPPMSTEYRLDLGRNGNAVNMTMIRISIGHQSSTFRYVKLDNGEYAVRSTAGSFLTSEYGIGSILLKSSASVDSLNVSAAGYKSAVVRIASYEGNVNITLETENTGSCTQSKSVKTNLSGTGPHKVVIETNADAGIKEGTIYRPADLGPGKNYPIFIWGNGACSMNGYSNDKAMTEIASHGYFVIADGTPNGGGSRDMDLEKIKKPARAYVTWAIAENRKPCSAYYQSLDTSKVAGNGFSCGGFFGQALAGDPRTTTWGVTSSGSFGEAPGLWNSVHTPVIVVVGSPSGEIGNAYQNGLRDYNGISALGHPCLFFSNKNFGHGGDLGSTNGGEFTKINLAWLNWWLKGDTGATGKGVLVGSSCKYCTDRNWEYKSANIPQ